MPIWIVFLFLFAMVFVGVVITELSAHNTNQIKNIKALIYGMGITRFRKGVWKRYGH